MRSFLVNCSVLAASFIQSSGWATPLFLSPAPLMTTAGQPDDPRYARNAGRGYDGIGRAFFERPDGLFSCTGSLLSSGRHVLTAAHCVTDRSGEPIASFGDVTFELPAGTTDTLPVSSYSLFPGWTGDLRAGGDLALLTLGRFAAREIPRYSLYSGTDDVGRTAELVGYGATGSGVTGYQYQDGLRRGGRNRFDGTFVGTLDRYPGWTAGDNMLLIDFDDGSPAHDALAFFGLINRGAGLDEIFPAPGDSGAPAFLGGQITGVASFSTRIVGPGGASQDIDSELNRSFGEISALTRVSRYEDWITANTVPIPEPNQALLLCTSLLFLVGRTIVSRRCCLNREQHHPPEFCEAGSDWQVRSKSPLL